MLLTLKLGSVQKSTQEDRCLGYQEGDLDAEGRAYAIEGRKVMSMSTHRRYLCTCLLTEQKDGLRSLDVNLADSTAIGP